MRYEDRGVDMAAEFHDQYGCHYAPVPVMPALDEHDALLMESVSLYLASYAGRLKELAAGANATGRTNLGLLLVRIQLLVEETGEVAGAFAEQDLGKALRELVDVSYSADGTYLTLGCGHLKLPAYREVHRANMSRLDDEGQPIISDAGRVLKGPNYVPPEVEAILAQVHHDRHIPTHQPDLIEPWDR